MDELQIKFGWRRRLKILFGGSLSIFLDREIVGTFVDKNGDAFVEVKERPPKNNKEMVCLFG